MDPRLTNEQIQQVKTCSYYLWHLVHGNLWKTHPKARTFTCSLKARNYYRLKQNTCGKRMRTNFGLLGLISHSDVCLDTMSFQSAFQLFLIRITYSHTLSKELNPSLSSLSLTFPPPSVTHAHRWQFPYLSEPVPVFQLGTCLYWMQLVVCYDHADFDNFLSLQFNFFLYFSCPIIE